MPHSYNREAAHLFGQIAEGIFNEGVTHPSKMLMNIINSYQFSQGVPKLLAALFHTDEEGLNALFAKNALASGCDHHSGGEETLRAIVDAARNTGKYTSAFALKPEHWKESPFVKEAKEAEEKAEVKEANQELKPTPPDESTFRVKQVNSFEEFLSAMGLRRAH